MCIETFLNLERYESFTWNGKCVYVGIGDREASGRTDYSKSFQTKKNQLDLLCWEEASKGARGQNVSR